MNKKVITVIFIIVSLFVVSSLNSVAISNQNAIENEVNLKSNSMVLRTRPIIQTISLKSQTSNTLSVNAEPDNNAITDEVEDEYRPVLAANLDKIMAAYESDNGTKKDIYFRNSNSYGRSWSDPLKIELEDDYEFLNDYDFIYPSMGGKPNTNKAYTSFVSTYKNSATYGYSHITNIGDLPSQMTFSILDWANVTYNETNDEFTSFWGFKDSQIIHYDDSTTPWIMTMIGSTNFSDETTGEGPCDDAPMFSFVDLENPGSYVSIAWFPEIEYCSNISIANYYGNDTVFGICEINNGSNQDLLFFKGTPNDFYYGEYLVNQTLTSDEDLLHPKITVTETDIYIVAETDTGIVLYHSTDAGNSWTIKEVTLSGQPSFPDILAVNESHIACTFVESGNLSITYSNDTGANWTTPEKLNSQNGSVVGGYCFLDAANNNQIAWTDNRNGNNDIYYYVGVTPEVDLTVTNFVLKRDLPILRTNNIISITVKNQADGYAENVKLIVIADYDEANSTVIKTEFIPYISQYEVKTINYPLFNFKYPDFFDAFINFAGIKNLTVIIDSNNQYESGPSFDDNNLTKAINYDDIFPRLGFGFLEELFKTIREMRQ